MRARIPIILAALVAAGLTPVAASAASTAHPGSAAPSSGNGSWQPEPASECAAQFTSSAPSSPCRCPNQDTWPPDAPVPRTAEAT